ncbi:putative mitochondrial glutamyl-tRNA amidotransferase subunit A precursor [Podospora fimiseda]|uniref:Glutamyl-tRNA(Gln) amidotransferase subunit A, mitochondrial n=1 Tax=Podospora fimiseda TaxID=252190 RepID=A0AAN7BUY8_9PEZI|nr:putative mitochondrial glutamyl-tRNA amidotransferase subunit A precursor [Podospora fimiseda]
MIARARLRGSSPSLHHATLRQHHQRRLLNHFISKSPSSADPIIPKTSQFTLAVKDNIATTSPFPTTCASDILSNYTSPIEATIVTQLRSLGANITGKTNLDEFGMGSHSTHSAFGPVSQDSSLKDPISAGGSSGGSAVAVANKEVDLALGTDTGGSVRLPAAYTGVAGYKPSYGMISRYGVIPYANSLDTVGFLSRQVKPIRELIAGFNSTESAEEIALWKYHDSKDPTSLSLSARLRCAKQREGYNKEWDQTRLNGLKFGVPLEYNIEELDPRIRDAWAAAAERLEQKFGAKIVPVSLPTTKQALAAYYVIAPAEASSNLAKYDGVRYGKRNEEASSDAAGGVLYAATRGKGFGEEVKRRILLGSYTLSSEAMDNYFIKAQKVRRLVRRDFNRVFALENPLQESETFELSDLPDNIEMEDKWGPEEVDFLLCPTAPTLAPKLADVVDQKSVDSYMNDVFTVPASLAGLPAISIPMPVASEDGTKTAGLQLIGQYWDDARLLGVAEAMSKSLQTK